MYTFWGAEFICAKTHFLWEGVQKERIQTWTFAEVHTSLFDFFFLGDFVFFSFRGFFDRSGAPRGNTSLHMSLEQVLGFGFKFWTLPFLCKTNPAMALQPDGTLVCKEHVFERLFRTSATLREG